MKKGFFAVILLCVVFLFGPSQSGAAIIKIDFGGTVAYFDGDLEDDAPVSVGDDVVGSWSYQTDAVFDGDNIIKPNVSFFFKILGQIKFKRRVT